MNKILIIVLAIMSHNIELRASNMAFNHSINRSGDFLTQATVDTTNRKELLNKVEDKGQIKIWVYHNMKFIPENRLNPSEIFDQRSEIQKKRTELFNELKSRNLFSKPDYESKRRPVFTIAVDEETLRFLLKSEKVKKISIVERATPN